jgi:hypothetical protein
MQTKTGVSPISLFIRNEGINRVIVLSCTATIKLFLRRALQLSVILLSNVPNVHVSDTTGDE